MLGSILLEVASARGTKQKMATPLIKDFGQPQ